MTQLKAQKDTVFRKPINQVKDFVFDETVASVFDDMISRSVPHYQEVQSATALIARKLYLPNSLIYDLGCSTGTTLLLLSNAFTDASTDTSTDTSVQIVGVDNSRPMLDICQQKLDACRLRGCCIQLVESNIEQFLPTQASVVIMNYSLQFIDPAKRLKVLTNICHSLIPGGAVVVTEKVAHNDPSMEELLTELYYDFKRRNGYSQLEISNKREALENVLVPWTLKQNISLLKNAGFRHVEVFLKWYNFASFVART